MNERFPFGITFHHLHGGTHPASQGSLSAEAFADTLQSIGVSNILSPGEWIERAETGKLEAHHRCVTFDDNLRCQFDVALPVLDRLGIRAFWFVNTSVLEGQVELLEVFRYFRTLHYPDIDSFYADFESSLRKSPWANEAEQALSRFNPEHFLQGFGFYSNSDKRFRFVRDEILGPKRYLQIAEGMMHSKGFDPKAPKWAKALWMDGECLRLLDRSGHVVGMHSHSHPTKLGGLPASEQRTEYGKCFDLLRETIGRPPVAMSHPCNSYGPETLEVLKDLGIRIGFRANILLHPYSPLEQPRLDQALFRSDSGA
jgi:peptidoglycan/xylan/chitin deacetylase (PgdA/CDA1 family)